MNRENLRRIVPYILILLVVGFTVYNSFVGRARVETPRPLIETAYRQGIEALVPILFVQYLAVALLGLIVATALSSKTGFEPAIRVSSKRGALFLVFIVLAFAAVVGSMTLDTVQRMGVYYHYYRQSPPPIYLPGDPPYLLNLVLSFLPLVVSASMLGWLIWRVRRRSEEVRQTTLTNTSELDTPIPDEVKTWAEALHDLGFTRLGEGQYRKAGQAAEQFDLFWLLIGDEGRGLATIAVPPAWKAPAALVFASYFHDGAVVETYFPHVMRLQRPDHLIDHEASSIEAAYRLHREQVASFADVHGEPLRILDMQTAIEQAQNYNACHLSTVVDQVNRQMLIAPTGLLLVSVLGAGLTLAAVFTRGLVGNNLVGFVFPTTLFSFLYWVFVAMVYKWA